MFCFCLQSSLLKLQALEVEGGPSLGSSPENSPPPLGSKEQGRSSCAMGVRGEKEGNTLALCHSCPADENSPPESLRVYTRPPQSTKYQPLAPLHAHQQQQQQKHQPDLNHHHHHHPSLQPLHPLTPPPSPHPSPYSPQRGGGGGGVPGASGDFGGALAVYGGEDGREGGGVEDVDGGAGALLHLIGGGHSPLPSPRCSGHSLRFNSDPEAAPSPPCAQQYMLARGRERTEGPAVVSPSSVPLLTRHIGTLKKKVRRFEERFEQEMNYKPSYNDKNANPEMVKVMLDLAKSRKQLKEMKLRHSVFDSNDLGPEGTTGDSNQLSRGGSSQQGEPEQHEPTLEETVESLFGRLREKRQTLGLPDNMKEMTQGQMVLEKITLQKCLLYFESLHGRPGSKQGRNLVKPLYDRYQMIKRLLCASPTTITTIEEEEGSDEDYTNHHQPAPPPCRVTWQAANEEDSDRDSDPALVSPILEVKDVREKSPITVINLHEASRSELVLSLRETRVEKKRIRKGLREFEDEFYRQTGRTCQKEDRTPMSEEYQEYKQLKAKLRLLEILISKQEVN
ncbi:unnamed protein product [Boreogadus saida]